MSGKITKNFPAHSRFDPEVTLIIAVYRQAKNDLLKGCKCWRQDAKEFFEADGWDVDEIRRA